MRFLAIVLSAGVVTGLLVYVVLEWQGWIAITINDLLTMRIMTFVGILVAMGFGSAALALAFRAAFAREDRRALRELEQRIAQLELTARPAAPPAPAPAHPPAE